MGFFTTLQNWFWPGVPGSNPNAANVANPFAAPSDPAASRDPYSPDPYFDRNYTPTLSPVPTNPLADQVRADSWVMPYTGVLDLDDYGRETDEMRMTYRQLHRREPSIRAAIEGKNAAVASLDVTVIPEDEDNPADCRAAEFVEWSVSRTMHGWDGAISRVFRPALIDGFSVNEKVLKSHTDSRKWKYLWGLRHLKNRDTINMQLRLDAYRNVLGIVNTVRGLRTHAPEKVMLFTHADLYDNPFGQSDIRAAYRSANLIEEAYKLWYLAIKIYGAPFLKGAYGDPVRRDMLFKAMQTARGGGVLVCDKDDEVEVLNMASATSFDAFEKKVNKHREEIYLAIRGAYLPFLEGQGKDANGDTAVHKVASDAVEYLCAKAIGRAFSLQLVPDLVIPNFGEKVGMPQVILGGVNWSETKQQIEVANTVMEKAAISKRYYYKMSQMPPPDGPEDAIGGPPPDPAGGMPGAPAPIGTHPGFKADGSLADGKPPAAGGPPPAKADEKKDSTFAAGLAPDFASYFAPDRHGRYPGNLHEQFPGMNVQQFADATGLIRKATGKGETQTWHWAPRIAAVPTASIGTDPARLQFRQFDGADGLTAGRRAENAIIGTFDPAKAPPIAVWRDPATAKTFVVDGHKRLASAAASGVRAIRAWFVSAKTADQARSIGANLNAQTSTATANSQTFAKDASGREHKGDGEGGGQFAPPAGSRTADLKAAGDPKQRMAEAKRALAEAEHPHTFAAGVSGEPRDSDGKWTSGAGGSGPAAPAADKPAANGKPASSKGAKPAGGEPAANGEAPVPVGGKASGPKAPKAKAIRGEMTEARREGQGKEAKVVLGDGTPAPEHIKPAMIQDGWTGVMISLDPHADVLVLAMGPKSRANPKMVPQTVYSDSWGMKTDATKFSRVHEGLNKEAEMHDQNQQARKESGTRDSADAVWLMQVQATRPGGEADTKGVNHLFGQKLTASMVVANATLTDLAGRPLKNKDGSPATTALAIKVGEHVVAIRDQGTRDQLLAAQKSGNLRDTNYWLKSYGATTLEGRHVVESADGLRLQFVGKEGVYHDHLIHDQGLGKMLLERKKKAGEGGKLFPETNYAKVTKYTKTKLDSGLFTPKDFRTMRGTSLATETAAGMPIPKTEKAYEAAVMSVAEKVAGVLGNRPQQALKTYISPAVFAGWRTALGLSTGK